MKFSTFFIPLVLLITTYAHSATSNISQPNIIIILADDLGYGNLSSYGGDVPTPNIDKLAAQGLLFTDFHSSGTSCSPTRAGLVTGRYQHRSGVDGVINADPAHPTYQTGISSNKEITYPSLLKSVGYKNALIGKWHLGYLPQFNPMNIEFDVFKGFLSGNIDYISHYDRMQTYDWWEGKQHIKERGYSTHLITDHTIDFIKQNKSQPFSVLVAHEAVHSPMQGPNSPIQRGPDKAKNKKDRKDARAPEQVFDEMLTELDKSVGKIMQSVVDEGIAERTLIIFTSDNGPMKYASAGPLKGGKGSMAEGGHRVPMIAWWPGTIQAGNVSDETLISLDFMPMMLALSGAKSPLGHQYDGLNMTPALLQKPMPKRQFFWRNSGINNAKITEPVGYEMPKAIRDGDWKLIASAFYDDIKLYDLSNDIGETKNLASKHPQRVNTMLKSLKDWEREMKQTLIYTTKK